jgi:hypothetical protein
MKGIIFTSLLEIVEERHGLELVDEILTGLDLASGGAYTAVGNYDDGEAVAILTRLAELQSESMANTLTDFGRALFQRLARWHPDMAAGIDDTFEFLEQVEHEIHGEVRKLYPDARLPSILAERSGNRLTVTYRSERALADLAYGLMLGCADHYGDDLRITRESLGEPEGSHVRFVIER